MKNRNQHKILSTLEAISRDHPKKILRINGYLYDEDFELLIYKGISSCTTHPTEIDINSSSLPIDAILKSAELIHGPLDPSDNIIIKESVELEYFLINSNWAD